MHRFTTPVRRMQAKGTSMKPLFSDGDMLTIGELSPKMIYRGDIVVFMIGDRLVGHRVVEITSAHIITKGDNVTFRDAPIRLSEVVGKVIKIQYKGGGVVDLTHPKARLLTSYCLFISSITYTIPLLLQKALYKLLRGRTQLVRLIKDEE